MKFTDITDFLGMTNFKERKEQEPETRKFNREELGPKEVYLKWEGLPKPVTTNIDPRFRKTFMIIGSVVVLLFLLIQEYFLLLLVASLFFMTHVLSKSSLDDLKYEISNYGVSINGDMYYWDNLERFFFAKQFGSETLAIDVKEGLPTRLFLAFKNKDKEKLKEFLNKHIPFLEEEPMTFMDRAYNSVIEKFDYEKK